MGQTIFPKRPNRAIRFASDLLFIAILAAGTAFAAYFNLILPVDLLKWLWSYDNPTLTLFWFGLGFAAFVVLVIKIGIIFSPITKFVENRSPFVQDYLCSSPYWLVTIIFLGSFFFMWATRPYCQAPTIIFHVQEQGKITRYVPGSIILTEPNTTLIITASDIEDREIKCQWSNTGDVIAGITPSGSCAITVRSDVISGSALFTVNASQGFCKEYTLAPVGVRVPNN